MHSDGVYLPDRIGYQLNYVMYLQFADVDDNYFGNNSRYPNRRRFCDNAKSALYKVRSSDRADCVYKRNRLLEDTIHLLNY